MTNTGPKTFNFAGALEAFLRAPWDIEQDAQQARAIADALAAGLAFAAPLPLMLGAAAIRPSAVSFVVLSHLTGLIREGRLTTADLLAAARGTEPSRPGPLGEPIDERPYVYYALDRLLPNDDEVGGWLLREWSDASGAGDAVLRTPLACILASRGRATPAHLSCIETGLLSEKPHEAVWYVVGLCPDPRWAPGLLAHVVDTNLLQAHRALAALVRSPRVYDADQTMGAIAALKDERAQRTLWLLASDGLPEFDHPGVADLLLRVLSLCAWPDDGRAERTITVLNGLWLPRPVEAMRGHSEPKSLDLVRHIIRTPSSAAGDWTTGAAQLSKPAACSLAARLQVPDLGQLLSCMIADPDASVAREAVRHAGWWEAEECMEALGSRLAGADLGCGMAACRSLGLIGGSAAIKTILAQPVTGGPGHEDVVLWDNGVAIRNAARTTDDLLLLVETIAADDTPDNTRTAAAGGLLQAADGIVVGTAPPELAPSRDAHTVSDGIVGAIANWKPGRASDYPLVSLLLSLGSLGVQPADPCLLTADFPTDRTKAAALETRARLNTDALDTLVTAAGDLPPAEPTGYKTLANRLRAIALRTARIAPAALNPRALADLVAEARQAGDYWLLANLGDDVAAEAFAELMAPGPMGYRVDNSRDGAAVRFVPSVVQRILEATDCRRWADGNVISFATIFWAMAPNEWDERRALREPALSFLGRAAASRSARIRAAAAAALLHQDAGRFQAWLERARDGTWSDRLAAAEAAAHLPDDRAFDGAMQTALSDADIRVRETIPWARERRRELQAQEQALQAIEAVHGRHQVRAVFGWGETIARAGDDIAVVRLSRVASARGTSPAMRDWTTHLIKEVTDKWTSRARKRDGEFDWGDEGT